MQAERSGAATCPTTPLEGLFKYKYAHLHVNVFASYTAAYTARASVAQFITVNGSAANIVALLRYAVPCTPVCIRGRMWRHVHVCVGM